ncbi:peptidoglycan binding domain-containing protein [Gordonibacter pamelaeae]|uniref:L,D-transpeptidase family protein n=1 Tax=Gordonibacter pamelaeae TaxID=471189 RepID=UPI00210D0D11|nr:peptidoglycan binding domain-containing protein [Gordonibacter pamelaeae]MCQ4847793.1 peptidoglycan binding domain-containing protein [Gordonibacter pamelaeae]MCQ4850249.1 peptidoglycan binding domain-containing protein [Gordonibacter pamelaeae]
MNDKKNSKARHARHAAPTPQPGSDAAQEDSSPASHAAPPKSAAPAKTPPDAPAPGKVAPGKPVPGQTAVMPQPVRPVAPNAKAKPGGQPGQPAFAGGPMLPVDVSEADAKGGRKPLKVLGIVLGVIVALLAVVYLAGALVFMDRFLPRTTVGDLDVSLKSSAEVQGMLADVIDDYVLKVEGQGFSLKLSAAEAGMRLDGRAATDAMHASANAWAWPLEILKAHDESDKLTATYNESGLGDTVRAAVDEFNKTATPPTDAVIAYSEAKGAFIVEPEAVGTALSYDAVIKAVDDAVLALQPTVKLGADVLQQPKVLSSDPKLTAAAEQANTMIKADLVLTMAGGTAGEVNADLISQWVRLGDDLSATLDEAALTAWVDELAAACNTVGTQRTYTRPDGKVVTVAGGVYGWSVDRDALLNLVKESVAAGTVQTAEVPCTSVGTGYNGAGAQDWGLRYCDIDLAEQYARFYDETGALIWESPIVSGIPDGVHDTSVGVYWLNQKASPSKLIGYENGKKIYESDVQYWMPFVGNVIGLHDADWQSSFGGTRYRDGAGSHGCVNLPPYKAAELYGIIQSGDVVVSHW